jgi:hypothetical protein
MAEPSDAGADPRQTKPETTKLSEQTIEEYSEFISSLIREMQGYAEDLGELEFKERKNDEWYSGALAILTNTSVVVTIGACAWTFGETVFSPHWIDDTFALLAVLFAFLVSGVALKQSSSRYRERAVSITATKETIKRTSDKYHLEWKYVKQRLLEHGDWEVAHNFYDRLLLDKEQLCKQAHIDGWVRRDAAT